MARRGHPGANPPSASHCRSVSASLCAARLAAVGESRARLTAVQDRFGIFAPVGVCQCAIATLICQPSTARGVRAASYRSQSSIGPRANILRPRRLPRCLLGVSDPVQDPRIDERVGNCLGTGHEPGHKRENLSIHAGHLPGEEEPPGQAIGGVLGVGYRNDIGN